MGYKRSVLGQLTRVVFGLLSILVVVEGRSEVNAGNGKVLRDSQDISDVTFGFGNDGWRVQKILPQGWKVICGQQRKGQWIKRSIKEGKKISEFEEEEKNNDIDKVDRAMVCEL